MPRVTEPHPQQVSARAHLAVSDGIFGHVFEHAPSPQILISAEKFEVIAINAAARELFIAADCGQRPLRLEELCPDGDWSALRNETARTDSRSFGDVGFSFDRAGLRSEFTVNGSIINDPAFGVLALCAFDRVAERRDSNGRADVDFSVNPSSPEGWFRNLADAAPVFIWMFGPDRNLAYINRTFLDFLGENTAERLRDDWRNTLNQDDLTEFRGEFVRRFESHQEFAFDVRIRRADNVERKIAVRGVPRFDPDGRFLGFVGTGVDITEKLEAIERLTESEMRFRQIAEGLPQLVWTCRGEDGYCDYLSPQWVRYTGIPEKQQLGFLWVEQIHPDDREPTIAKWTDAVATDGQFLCEFRIRRHDGVFRWFQTRAVPLRDATGRVVKWFGTNTDIHDRRRTEEALFESERRFRVTFEQAAVGIAHVGLDGSWLFVNERLCNITGYSKDELLCSTFQQISHPEDVENDWDLVRRVIRGEILTYSVEKRFVRKDRSVVWINLTVSVVRDSDSLPQYFTAVVEDISRRKAAERELRQWADAFGNCAQGLAIIDHESDLIDACNPAFAEICGSSPVDLVGMSFAALCDKSASEDVHEFLATADDLGQIQFEMLARRRDGSQFAGLIDLVSVRGEGGAVLYRVATLQDVSARQRAEKALRESEGKLRLFVEYAPAAVAMLDANLDYLVASRRWLQDYGIEGNVAGRNYFDCFPLAPIHWHDSFNGCLVGGSARIEENRIERADGTISWLKWEARPWFDASGEIGGVMIFSEDTTAAKRRESTLRFLSDLTERLLLISSIDEILEYVGEHCHNQFSATKCGFVEGDEKFGTVRIAHEWRLPDTPSLIGEFNMMDYVDAEVSKALRDGNPVVVDDISNDSRVIDAGLFEKLEIGSLIMVPVIRQGDWKFSFGIYRRVAMRWSGDEIALLVDAIERIWNRLERIRVETALGDEKTRTETIAESSPSVICSFRLAPTGRFSFPFISPAVRDVFGIDPETVARRGERLFRRISREDFPRLKDSMERSILTMSLWNDSFRYEHPVKGEIWVEGYSTPIRESDGSITWHGILSDVTERKQGEQLLMESEKRYRLMFENSPLPMWVYDLETLRFLAVNQAAVDAYGFTRDEFLAAKMPEICGHDTDYYASMSTRTGDARRTSESHLRRDGTQVDVEVVSHGIIFDGRPARFTIANDVTERRRAEKLVREMNEILEQKVIERTSELNSVNRELESFSYSVSHDLRAPLRAMDGFSLALIEDYEHVLDDEGRNYLHRIRLASQKMAQLIDDLLKLSRASRGELNRTTVDLSAMVTDITAQFMEFQPKSSVEIEIEPGVKVFADEQLMRVALENLIGNAWKFTSRSDNAKIEFGKVEIDGESFAFVRDNGAGFDMAFAHKLFGAFQRLHTATEFEGTGIGLATVQRIVNRHAGRIWAEGETDKGAVFYFSVSQ